METQFFSPIQIACSRNFSVLSILCTHVHLPKVYSHMINLSKSKPGEKAKGAKKHYFDADCKKCQMPVGDQTNSIATTKRWQNSAWTCECLYSIVYLQDCYFVCILLHPSTC